MAGSPLATWGVVGGAPWGRVEREGGPDSNDVRDETLALT